MVQFESSLKVIAESPWQIGLLLGALLGALAILYKQEYIWASAIIMEIVVVAGFLAMTIYESTEPILKVVFFFKTPIGSAVGSGLASFLAVGTIFAEWKLRRKPK